MTHPQQEGEEERRARLRAALEEASKGRRQRAVARRIGKSPTWVAKFLARELVPPAETLDEVEARLAGIPTDYDRGFEAGVQEALRRLLPVVDRLVQEHGAPQPKGEDAGTMRQLADSLLDVLPEGLGEAGSEDAPEGGNEGENGRGGDHANVG